MRTPGTVRWVAIGDTGRGDATQARVAAATEAVCAERGCDLLLLLGDLLYPRGMEAPDDPRADAVIAEPYRALGVPVFLVLGNHDYAHGRNRERAEWLIAWAARTQGVELAGHAWQVQAGPMSLIGLDTASAFQYGAGPQAAWLDRQLLADVPWTVVAGHHPLRSNGPHGNAGSYEGLRGLPWVSGIGLAGWLGELCGRADLYLAGHDHSQQLLRHCGVDLVVSGAGSSATRLVDRGNVPRFARAEPGLAWLELSETSGRIAFFDADGSLEGSFEVAGP